MKLRCDRARFLERLSLVAPIAAARNTRPILQHVLIEVEGDRVWLSTTDLELTARCELTLSQPGEDGRLCLPASRLVGILREMRGESFDLSADGRVANLRTSTSQFHLSGDEPDEFPTVVTGEGEHFAELPTPLFRELAQRTEFAASKEPGRYAINGILVELDGTDVRFVATDGRRLAQATGTTEKPVGNVREILPLKAITHFLKSLGPEIETVGLAVSGRRILMRAGSVMIGASSVKAVFPDFQSAIAKERPFQVVFDREEFFSSVRQAAVMAGDDTRAVNLRFTEGSLVFSAGVEGLGDAHVELGLDYAGEEVRLSFNPDYLLDFAKVPQPESLRLHFGKDSSVSALFEPDDHFQYVVMPVTTA